MIEKFKNFTALYDENEPLKIDIVGETYCDKTFKIERKVSDLNALEFIIDGKGTLDIGNQHLIPEKNDVFFGRKEVFINTERIQIIRGINSGLFFNGDFAESLIKCYLPKDVYLFKNCNAVKRYFEEIVETTRKDLPYDIMVNKITISLMHIFYLYTKQRVIMDNEELPDIIIEKNLDESVESVFNLDNLCRSVNYSKNYVIHVLKINIS